MKNKLYKWQRIFITLYLTLGAIACIPRFSLLEVVGGLIGNFLILWLVFTGGNSIYRKNKNK